jgi:hypothetical protein
VIAGVPDGAGGALLGARRRNAERGMAGGDGRPP